LCLRPSPTLALVSAGAVPEANRNRDPRSRCVVRAIGLGLVAPGFPDFVRRCHSASRATPGWCTGTAMRNARNRWVVADVFGDPSVLVRHAAYKSTSCLRWLCVNRHRVAGQRVPPFYAGCDFGSVSVVPSGASVRELPICAVAPVLYWLQPDLGFGCRNRVAASCRLWLCPSRWSRYRLSA